MPACLASLRRVAALLASAAMLAAAAPLPAAAVLTGLPPGFVDELVVGGLPFPTAVAFTPDGRMLVALKRGEVRLYEGTTPLGTFLDISARVHDNHDRGLLGLAVHPDFPDTPYVYLLYTHDPSGVYPDGIAPGTPPPTSVPARVAQLLRVEADPATGYATAKAGTEVVLLGTNSTRANIGSENDGRNTALASCMSPKNMSGAPVEDCIPSDENSHTIGTVVFAPDGSLFVSSGDGSNYGGVDARALRAQNLDSLAGKILRIDPITGLGLPDNPFYDPASPSRNRSKVWSYGVRNPFRISVHPLTSEPFLGDVGWSTWEEIDTGKGANFGWPCYEGGAVSGSESGVTTSRQQSSYRTSGSTSAACAALYAQGLGAVKAPTFTYDHSAGGASANGGAFYTGSTYPSVYQGALFIADYNRRWIRYLTFDAQGQATVHPFGTESSSSSGPVQLITGLDTNLYWMKYASSGGELRRVRYTGGGNTPPVVVADAAPRIGFAPLAVAFDANASYDPDAQPLAYEWDFGDGATSTEKNPSHVYATPGVYDAVLTVSEQTAPFASNSASVRITAGNNPPLASIAEPADGATYRVGDAIAFSGGATAGGDPVPAAQLSWELRTLHNQHAHFDGLDAAPDPLDPFVSRGSFTVDDHGDEVRFELCLTATVLPEGLTDTQCIDLFPEKTQITLATDPVGLRLSYEDEGLELFGPALIEPVVNAQQTVSVLPVQDHRSFVQWEDGSTSLSRTFSVGTEPRTFTAFYENRTPQAVIAPAGASGSAPLSVAFDGTGSSDPESDELTYAWDAGPAGTSSEPAPTFTFTAPGEYPVTLSVTDQLGASDAALVVVSVNDGVPVPTVTAPGAGTSWDAGSPVAYAGEAVDANGAPLPPSQLSFAFYLHVCDAAGENCEAQLVGTSDGVAGGSFDVPAVFAAGATPGPLEIRLGARSLPPAGWLDAAWSRRRRLAIDNTAQAEAFADFPLLVRLDPTRIDYAAAQPAGQDLRFTDAAGQLLDHEIESWSPGGTSIVWVRVPSIPAASGAGAIYLYYGNPAAPDAQDPAGVWQGYAGVWHMDASLADSTGQLAPGVSFGTTADAGAFGEARRFDGASWVDAGTGPSLDLAGALTVEAWIAVDDPAQPGHPRVLSKKAFWNDAGFNLEYKPGDDNLTSVGSGDDFARADFVALDTGWHFVGAALDGATGRMFVDGVDRTSDPTLSPVVANPAQSLRFGREQAEFFLGRIDEIRIAPGARTAAWFAAQHLSMTDAFLDWGAEETFVAQTGTTSLFLAADTVVLPFDTAPSGLSLAIGGQPLVAPGAVTAVVGATGLVEAPSPQTLAGTVYVFASWSDGSAQSHEVEAAPPALPRVATYQALPACGDGIDNDGDGLTDHPNDPSCFHPMAKTESPQCDDGADNDGDGKVDWDGAGVATPDPDCSVPWRNREGASACGLGFELALLLPWIRRLRRLRGRAG